MIKALWAIIVAALAAFRSARAGTFQISVSSFNSGALTNSLGTRQFSFSGTTDMDLSLAVGDSVDLVLDGSGEGGFETSPTNLAPPGYFTGVIPTTITINGVAETTNYSYSLDGTLQGFISPAISGGPLWFTISARRF